MTIVIPPKHVRDAKGVEVDDHLLAAASGSLTTFRNSNGAEWVGVVLAESDGPASLVLTDYGKVMLPTGFRVGPSPFTQPTSDAS